MIIIIFIILINFNFIIDNYFNTQPSLPYYCFINVKDKFTDIDLFNFYIIKIIIKFIDKF